MPIKVSFRKNKQRTPATETVKIVTVEDLFSYISDSKQRIKEKRKENNHPDFDVSADDGDDSDENRSIVRVHGSDYRSDSADDVS